VEQETHENNKLKDQIRSLRSGNRLAILTTLKELRSDGEISVLPDLFDLLCDQEDDQIILEITSILNDLKEEEAVPYLVEAIRNPDYSEVKALLVSACWQNGLSYGNYLETFLEVFIHGSYEASIEAFTVIEEAAGEAGKSGRNQLVLKLKSQINKVDEPKKPLLSELIRSVSGQE